MDETSSSGMEKPAVHMKKPPSQTLGGKDDRETQEELHQMKETTAAFSDSLEAFLKEFMSKQNLKPPPPDHRYGHPPSSS